MKSTVSGTDDQGQRHVSQTSTSSETKTDVTPITTPRRQITYTTAQLHENATESTLTIGRQLALEVLASNER